MYFLVYMNESFGLKNDAPFLEHPFSKISDVIVNAAIYEKLYF